MSFILIIKHAGKSQPIRINPANTTTAEFRTALSNATGVPIDRMKVMIKGGLLKDHTDLSSLELKPEQVVTVIGTAGLLPAAPPQPVVFLEDMDHQSLNAYHANDPPGLINLGQTCYLNSTLQAVRVISQIRSALDSFSPSSSSPESRLTTSIRNLFTDLSQSPNAVAPFILLNHLRTLAPQFAEQDGHGHFSQQDADEAWTQIISALRTCLSRSGLQGEESVIDEAMSINLTRSLLCVDAPNELPTVSREKVLKLECNISISTNYLMSGILDSLNQQIEKTSPTLGRMATYNQKKAKIMRKVKFPLQLDVTDIVTDEMRERIRPINTVVKQVLKARDDRARLAKRSASRPLNSEDDEKHKAAEERTAVNHAIQSAGFAETDDNPSGIYELSAMVTHKGASADSGHYIGWTIKETETLTASGDEEWLKFDDNKVSTVTAEKVLSLDGGGEDSVAYILLYRAVRI